MARIRAFVAALVEAVRSRGPQKAVAVVAGVAVVLLVAVGWFVITRGDDTDDVVAEPAATTVETTTTTAEPTTTTLSPEELAEIEVIEAYDDAMDAFDAAAAPPTVDPDDPAIEEHFTGEELDEMVAALDILARTGTAFRYPDDSVYDREVRDVAFGENDDGTETAALDLCIVTDLEEIRLDTGEPVPPFGGVWTVEATHVLHRVGGTWKVAEFEQRSDEEGITGCAAD